MNKIIEKDAVEATSVDLPIDSVRAFVLKERDGLLEILDLLGDDEAADAVRELEKLFALCEPGAGDLAVRLELVLLAFESVPLLVIEHAALLGRGPRDLHAAVRWYGARLADLCGAFPV